MSVQKRVLRFIRSFTRRNGYAPSVREIGEHVGFGPSGVQYLLERMEGDGLIARAPRTPRSIRVVERAS